MKFMRKKKVATALQAAYELVRDGHFTQEAFYRDKHGHSLEEDSEKAERFCALGVIRHVTHGHPLIRKNAERALEKSTQELFGLCPIETNDGSKSKKEKEEDELVWAAHRAERRNNPWLGYRPPSGLSSHPSREECRQRVLQSFRHAIARVAA